MNINNTAVEELNKQFSLHQGNHYLVFKAGDGDIPVIEIHNAQADARISLQGANVLSWVPAGENDVIWLSVDAKYAPGKSVRGGIPICWPWFGAHEIDSSYPGHGFARTVFWQVVSTSAMSADETQITFMLDIKNLDKKYQQMWPHATTVEYRITVGKTLRLELTTVNHSGQPIALGQALHTYFKVNDIRKTTVLGLDGKDYLDKTQGFARTTQSGNITFTDEVDRVYLNTADDNIIDDTKRKIIIRKQGSHSTVVWNPWIEVANKMGDLGVDGYLTMVCVESANAADDTVTINAGNQHTLQVIYSLES